MYVATVNFTPTFGPTIFRQPVATIPGMQIVCVYKLLAMGQPLRGSPKF